MVADIRRTLRPGGVYALNLIDGPAGRFARAEAATLAGVFAHTVVVAPGDALIGRGNGANFVLIASDAPIPEAAIRARLAERGATVVLADGREFAGRARPLTDDFAPVDQLLPG
jgi:hypothetical protein